MKAYSKMSDNEINKQVAYVLGYKSQGVGWIDNADGIYDYIAKSDHHTAYRHALPNYCNSWADAGKIIDKCGISVAFDEDEQEWVAFGKFDFDKCGWDMIVEPESYYQHKNPLRAAMITFLMMNEEGEE